MLSIRQFADIEDWVIALSGRVESSHVAEIQAIIDGAEKGKVVLDLKEVTLVGPEVIDLLARCEQCGVALRNCPAYVKAWVARKSHE
jgi:predicted Zn-ribbon and HTH transcriptional regulator